MDALDAKYGMRNQDLMTGLDNRTTALRNMCLSSAGLVIGSVSTAKVKIANTVTYLSDGVFKSKTTAEVAFTTTTHNITASASAVQEACYLLTLASDGTPTLTMGTIATGSGASYLPSVPSGGTPIGYVRVAVAAGSTSFAANSDALSAGHLTVTYVNLGGPVAPTFAAAL